ncbi:unnamed protein product [Arctia plantaginis]|uniref:Uncharacterized protein n=1 Tax=Arctia plantaginis TaxID=874455 RepID=A0A8S1AUF2_ARCPL|nr:unnamed protein product [Arctia plantaginis]
MKVATLAQIKQDSDDKLKMGDTNESRPDNINISVAKEKKDTQSGYIKDRASLESVMKFWAKFKVKDSTKTSTEKPSTHIASSREETIEIITPTEAKLANAPSMKYVSDTIAEYLRSQATKPTTEASKIRTMNMDIVSRTIKDFLDKNSKTDSLTVAKSNKNTLSKDLKELSDLTEIGKIFEENKKEERSEKDVNLQQKRINEDNQDKAKNTELTLFSSLIKVSPQTADLKSIKKMEALQYLNNMLKFNNKFKLNDPLPSMEISTQDSTNNNNHFEKLKKETILQDYYTNNSNYNHDMSSSTNSVKDKIGTVSTDVIKEIADKVKEILMRDIRKEIPTTERVTFLTTTISESTTANPTTALKEDNQTSVIRTLMELLKGLNTMKEETTTSTRYLTTIETLNIEKSAFHNLPIDKIYPSVIGGIQPTYVLKTPVSDIKQFEVNPFNQNLVPIPFGTNLHPPLHSPTYMGQKNFHEKSKYKMLPLTIQTNSAEIPPLVIQVSKPMKIMNQHIIVTTQNPFQKQREEKLHRDNEQRLNFNYADPLNVPSERNHHVDNPTYGELTKNLRLAEHVKKEFRESYKDKIEKLKERIEHNRDKATGVKQSIDSERSIGLSGLEKSKFHVSSSLDFNHHRGTSEISNDHDFLGRQLDPNRQEKFNRPINAHNRQILNEPSGINHRENFNRPDDSSYRDVIKREYLGRLVDSNHHNLMSQRLENIPDIRRPIDHQSRSRLSDAYERFEHGRSHPRYKATKFHERLEQIENMPQSHYNSYSRSTTEGCCDAFASRQQMPLNKAREHLRFDDSHFRNFLKSQQKVTDMLERILAAKSKTGKESADPQ